MVRRGPRLGGERREPHGHAHRTRCDHRALGMRPLGFLLGGVPGLLCLTSGIALDAGGLWWTHRMAVRATES